MATAIEQPAKRDHVNEQATSAEQLAQAAITRAAASSAATMTINHAAGAPLPGADAMDFMRDHRIHVQASKHDPRFVDPYLVFHPRELAPENEANFREKLKLTYTVNNPSFYESRERFAIAMNLAQLVPVSLHAQHSKLLDAVKKYNAQVESGADADLYKLDHDKHHPFAAIVRDTLEKPTRDPVGIEALSNGLTLYLLVREKLTQQKFLNPLSDYVRRAATPDQVLSDLTDKLGVTPLQMREAALKNGIDGVGQLLQLEPAYVADVKQLVAHAATQDFGLNIIEHWHWGRQLLGIAAPMAQKIATGLEARITNNIEKFRNDVRHFYDVPAPIKAEEKRIAEALNLLEPTQRVVMHKLGYEICYTPEITADEIAMYRGIYGLHRKAASDLRDTRGTYRIYFSGRGDLKGSMRTLVHEVAHNLWPEKFSAEEVQKIDALATSDGNRFVALHRMMSEQFKEFDQFLKAYQAGNDREKVAVAQSAAEHFKPYGIAIDAGILGYLSDANELRFLAAHAVDTLRIEGDRYTKSGYDSSQERFREIISRFAELKQVELSGKPQLMQFLAPGLNQVWENHYIPHLKRLHQQLLAEGVSGHSPATNKDRSSAPAVPKIEQRPVKPATPNACTVDAAPTTTIDAASIAHMPMMSEQMLAAQSALHTMGVHAGR